MRKNIFASTVLALAAALGAITPARPHPAPVPTQRTARLHPALRRRRPKHDRPRDTNGIPRTTLPPSVIARAADTLKMRAALKRERKMQRSIGWYAGGVA